MNDGFAGHDGLWCETRGDEMPASRGSDEGRGTHEVDHELHCEAVHRRLKRIVKARAALDAQEAEALRDAERLRVWRHYGYSSLLEYMEMEMGYTPRVAIERLRVAKAIVELPAIADAMAQGDLSFSAGRELTRVATAETEADWIEAVNAKNVRQVEELVAGHEKGDKPTDPVQPKLRKRRLRFDDIAPETIALVRQARQVLERELGERLEDDAFMRALARTVIDGARAEQRSHAPYQVAITVCAKCKRGTQDGAGIVVDMSPPTLQAALCDALHIGTIDDDATTAPGGEDSGREDSNPSVPIPAERTTRTTTREPESAAEADGRAARSATRTRAKSDIPPALRRKVNARDHGCCRVPWCRSARNIDQHHMVPVSRGGTHALENVISLCESHHIAHHEGALLIGGTASKPTFARRAQSAFVIAERVIETGLALKALGFDKHEVKAAVDNARTHVGTTDLSIEQWIKIALSYCPKPRSS